MLRVRHRIHHDIDIGEFAYTYATTLMAMGVANPYLALPAIAALLPRWLLYAWIATIVASLLVRLSCKIWLSRHPAGLSWPSFVRDPARLASTRRKDGRRRGVFHIPRGAGRRGRIVLHAPQVTRRVR